jgi:hypothetical protein
MQFQSGTDQAEAPISPELYEALVSIWADILVADYLARHLHSLEPKEASGGGMIAAAWHCTGRTQIP